MNSTEDKPSRAKYGKVKKLFGFYYILSVDPDGWWITCKKGYKTMMNFAFNKVTSPNGMVGHQIIFGRFGLLMIRPENIK